MTPTDPPPARRAALRAAGRALPGALAACLLASAAAVPAASAAEAPAPAAEVGSSRAAASAGAGWSEDQWGDDDTREDEDASRTGSWVAAKDLGSMASITRRTGAQQVWARVDPRDPRAHLTGEGVGVALLDTGVAPVEGMTAPGKLVHGPDLSFESQAEGTRYVDGYGHGTHMAGIIAGRDSAVLPGAEADPRRFVGMAPGATLVSLKVGAADGGADVTQVIAAIDWVVAHRADHDVRVLNLSYGLDSVQPSTLDPLAHAVENAWRAGVVVVAAAGNDGEDGATRLTMPAVDPFVLAVGSSDHHGSTDPSATTVGAWTNDGTDERRPDLLAPGKSVVSLRVPGSLADVQHPEGLVTGDATGRLFRGTGTSQSAAVVSGAAALLLQADPTLTPDQVKNALVRSADRLPGDDDPTQGAGELDVAGAYALVAAGDVGAPVQQGFAPSTGLGSLDAARAGSHVVDPDDGVVLTGEQDVFGEPWDAAAWAQASSAGTAWDGGTWRGSTWTGDRWEGTSWLGTTWASADWTRRSWSGADWSRRSWSTDDFSRRSWSSDDFSRRSWSADSFSRRSWSTGTWEPQPSW